MRTRIAETALRVMREAGETKVSFGDAILDDIARAAGLGSGGPRGMSERWGKVLDALERAPDLFVKSLWPGCDSRGLPRTVRLFEIK